MDSAYPMLHGAFRRRSKKAVETMTGLNVIEVNIHIQGVNIEREHKKEIAEETAKKISPG